MNYEEQPKKRRNPEEDSRRAREKAEKERNTFIAIYINRRDQDNLSRKKQQKPLTINRNDSNDYDDEDDDE